MALLFIFTRDDRQINFQLMNNLSISHSLGIEYSISTLSRNTKFYQFAKVCTYFVLFHIILFYSRSCFARTVHLPTSPTLQYHLDAAWFPFHRDLAPLRCIALRWRWACSMRSTEPLVYAGTWYYSGSLFLSFISNLRTWARVSVITFYLPRNRHVSAIVLYSRSNLFNYELNYFNVLFIL